MNKLEIKIPKRKSKVPIKSPRFLIWLNNKRQQKRTTTTTTKTTTTRKETI